MNRREFVLASAAALPFFGLLLPEPVKAKNKEYDIELVWEEVAGQEGVMYVWRTGFCDTRLFRAGLTTNEWYIAIGKLFRGGDLFRGTIEEAKAEAQRFTLQTLQKGVVAVEKVVYKIQRGNNV